MSTAAAVAALTFSDTGAVLPPVFSSTKSVAMVTVSVALSPCLSAMSPTAAFTLSPISSALALMSSVDPMVTPIVLCVPPKRGMSEFRLVTSGTGVALCRVNLRVTNTNRGNGRRRVPKSIAGLGTVRATAGSAPSAGLCEELHQRG